MIVAIRTFSISFMKVPATMDLILVYGTSLRVFVPPLLCRTRPNLAPRSSCSARVLTNRSMCDCITSPSSYTPFLWIVSKEICLYKKKGINGQLLMEDDCDDFVKRFIRTKIYSWAYLSFGSEIWSKALLKRGCEKHIWCENTAFFDLAPLILDIDIQIFTKVWNAIVFLCFKISYFSKWVFIQCSTGAPIDYPLSRSLRLVTSDQSYSISILGQKLKMELQLLGVIYVHVSC